MQIGRSSRRVLTFRISPCTLKQIHCHVKIGNVQPFIISKSFEDWLLLRSLHRLVGLSTWTSLRSIRILWPKALRRQSNITLLQYSRQMWLRRVPQISLHKYPRLLFRGRHFIIRLATTTIPTRCLHRNFSNSQRFNLRIDFIINIRLSLIRLPSKPFELCLLSFVSLPLYFMMYANGAGPLLADY